ncbi:MAG: AraC family transcriptional regulator, partial [Pseudomonadales bacterium]|nr:AraC family transcriptional regulator [Pseudomonadales bacterium]
MPIDCSLTPTSPFKGEVALPYWQSLVDVFRSCGLEDDSIETMAPSSVSAEQYIALFSKGVAHHEGFGLELGKSVSLGTLPVIGMILLSCHNLRQALEQILRYESLNHNLGVSRIANNEGETQYIWTPNRLYLPNPYDDLSFQLTLSVFASFKTFLPQLTKEEIPIKYVSFMAPKPKDAQRYKNFVDTELKFGQPFNAIAINSEVLDKVVTKGDATLFSALSAHADDLLLTKENQRDIIWQLKSIFPDALQNQTFKIEDIATQLNVSTRTCLLYTSDA